MSDEQMQAFIAHLSLSPNASDFAKRTCLWLLQHTDNLSIPVAMELPEEQFGKTLVDEVQYGVHDMASCNNATLINGLLKSMGTQVVLESHSGTVLSKPNMKSDEPHPGCTIWYSHIFYDRDMKQIPTPPIAEIKSIQFPR